ncbi:MAG TPA: hypothetical protein PKN45_10580 [Candidatus Limiplasma sp.]|nr:hypothetical protein [Candidatus Limiplasma sp.]
MTIGKLLAQFQDMNPSQYNQTVLIGWLSEVDGQISNTIHRDRDGMKTIAEPYTIDTSLDTPLLVPFPFDQIYMYWLSAMVDKSNQEFDRYGNEMQLFNSYYNAYAANVANNHVFLKSGEIRV